MIVVGAGIVGLATCAALRRHRVDVTCIDQADPGEGQSRGAARTFRVVHQGDEHVRMAIQARDAWIALEEETGTSLVGHEGLVLYGADLEDVNRWARLGVPVRCLDPAELAARAPFAGGREVGRLAVVDEWGGVIRAEAACRVLARGMRRYITKATVLGLLVASPTTMRVRTSAGDFDCGHVIVTAGAGTAPLVEEHGMVIPEHRGLHVEMTFRTSVPADWACLHDRSGDFEPMAYVVPIRERDQIAVGLYDPARLVDPRTSGAGANGGQVARAEQLVRAYVERAYPGGGLTAVATQVCLFTPLDGGFDDFAVWRRDGLTAVGGHNLFKFAPWLGEQLARSALAEPAAVELEWRDG